MLVPGQLQIVLSQEASFSIGLTTFYHENGIDLSRFIKRKNKTDYILYMRC